MPRIPGVKWQGEQDLFQFAAARYPERPGFKEPTTSKDAAEAAHAGAAGLRERVFEAIRYASPAGLTADQAASGCRPEPALGPPQGGGTRQAGSNHPHRRAPGE